MLMWSYPTQCGDIELNVHLTEDQKDEAKGVMEKKLPRLYQDRQKLDDLIFSEGFSNNAPLKIYQEKCWRAHYISEEIRRINRTISQWEWESLFGSLGFDTIERIVKKQKGIENEG